MSVPDPDRTDDFGVDPELGRVVLRCRDRREKEKLLALGWTPVMVYVLPLWCSIFSVPLFGLVLMAFEKRLGALPPVAVLWIAGLLYVSCCAALFYWLLKTPGKHSLVLCEDGFRYRGRAFLFRDVARIRFGRKMGRLEAAVFATNRTLGAVHRGNRGAAVMTELANAASLTVVLKDGSRGALQGVACQVEPEDYQKFIMKIWSEYPEFFEELAEEP